MQSRNTPRVVILKSIHRGIHNIMFGKKKSDVKTVERVLHVCIPSFEGKVPSFSSFFPAFFVKMVPTF